MPIDESVRAVNLLPPDMAGASKASSDTGARPEATGGAGPFVVLGVLAACVAGAAGYVLTDNTIKQRTSDLASAKTEAQQVTAQAEQLRPFADFDAVANARISTVRDLANRRFDWEQVFRDLSRAIPADVTLKDIKGDLGGAAGGAGVRGSISAPAITLDGCAPGQTQVARLMARLNDIDGVTRVSLSKSDNAKVDVNTTQTDTDAIKLRNSIPCGNGTHPSFEVVAFFEDTPAAAATTASVIPTPTPAAGTTATGTTATGTATATATATPAGSTTTTTASTSTSTGATP
jgi:Tfp pilus assembly protein PilN